MFLSNIINKLDSKDVEWVDPGSYYGWKIMWTDKSSELIGDSVICIDGS
jgi:hypothetical protein